MNKLIIYKNEAEQVTLVTPLIDYNIVFNELKTIYDDVFVLDENNIPNKKFLNAWKIQDKELIIDLEQAKSIIHNKRRKTRDRELLELDRLSTVPSYFEEIEQKRQSIRNKHAVIQDMIDSCQNVEELETILIQQLNGNN